MLTNPPQRRCYFHPPFTDEHTEVGRPFQGALFSLSPRLEPLGTLKLTLGEVALPPGLPPPGAAKDQLMKTAQDLALGERER